MGCPWSQKWTSPLTGYRISQNYNLKENLCFQQKWIFQMTNHRYQKMSLFHQKHQLVFVRSTNITQKGVQWPEWSAERVIWDPSPQSNSSALLVPAREGDSVTSWTTATNRLRQEDRHLQHRGCKCQCK